jgi:hypothetical protein
MIAATNDLRGHGNAHAEAPPFEELLPTIRSHAEYVFRCVHPCTREDLVSETIANAFCAYQRLIARGKGGLAYARPLTHYAVRQVIAGRRVGNKMNVRDITSEYCQRSKGVKVCSLDRYDRQEHEWKEIIVEDCRSGPAEIVAFKMDFAAWLHLLPSRTRKIAEHLATGETTLDTAHRFKLSPSRISQIRLELRDAWQFFQGEPTLDVVAN